jgi:hypothetical protein
MFVRIDRDLSVNINNILSYKLSEDAEAIKLQIWSIQGTILHTIFYLKNRPEQMKIIIDFNNAMRDLTVNPEIIRDYNIEDTVEDKENHIEEQLQLEGI